MSRPALDLIHADYMNFRREAAGAFLASAGIAEPIGVPGDLISGRKA